MSAATTPVTFEPVSRASVSDDVYRQLRDAIVSEAIEPGAPLAGERVLAEQFGVNRHAIREAIRRLEQARLVEVSHGGATRVLAWRTHAGLELLAELGTSVEVVAPGEMVRSVVEMRLSVGVDAARLAARRVSSSVAGELLRHVEELQRRDPTPALTELGPAYDTLWRLIVAASGNIAYQLADNSLVEALQRMPELALVLSEPEITDLAAQHDLVAAIGSHAEDEAAGLAKLLLERMVAASAGLTATG